MKNSKSKVTVHDRASLLAALEKKCAEMISVVEAVQEADVTDQVELCVIRVKIESLAQDFVIRRQLGW